MNVNFPVPTGGYSPKVLGQIFDQIRRVLLGVVTPVEAVPYLHLQSPAGKVFKVAVSDAGALVLTQVSTTQP